jgi:hypothetical protein
LGPGSWVYVDPLATYNDHRHTQRGSFGLLVRDLTPEAGDEDDRLILTAAHLFDSHDDDARVAHCPPGPEPGPTPGGPAAKHCGVLRRRVPLHRIPTIAVDAAVIKPPQGLQCSNETDGHGITGTRDLLTEHDESTVPISKLGAQTQQTTGHLKPVTADLRIEDQKVRYSMGWWAYGDQEKFADRGDSGAVVIDRARKVVGMLVAVEHDGPAAGAFVHGIRQILEALDIALYED